MDTLQHTQPLYREYHIINPASGKGKAQQLLPRSGDYSVYRTKCAGDVEQFIYSTCLQNPYSHFFVYGGDGTLHEAVNGIARANALDTAIFTPVAAGTGNDFMRSTATLADKDCYIDLLQCNDVYSLNMVNIGFDCHVADVASRYKHHRIFLGASPYIMGIVSTLCKKMGQPMKIVYTDDDGIDHVIDDNFLLVLCANGAYCGGGFYAMPCADLQDGYIHLLLVNNINRRQFLSMVPSYKKGTHMRPDGSIEPKFESLLRYIRCRSVTITANDTVCLDGEIVRMDTVKISVLPKALHVRLP